jgi:hypothetical protein
MVRRRRRLQPGVKQRPAVGNGIDGLVECRALRLGYVHPRCRVKHQARLARRQALPQLRANIDRVAGHDYRRICRHAFQRRHQQVRGLLVFRPHQRPEPEPLGGVGGRDRMQVDAGPAGDRRYVIEVRWLTWAMPLRLYRYGGARPAEHAPSDDVAIPVDVQVNAGARAHLYQVHWPPAALPDRPERKPQPGRPLHHVGLHQPGADQFRQVVTVHTAEVEQRGPGTRGVGGGRAAQRGIVAAERMLQPAEQQIVDRAEQQERSLLAGPPLRQEIKDGPVPGDCPAERPVQRRRREDQVALRELLRQAPGIRHVSDGIRARRGTGGASMAERRGCDVNGAR